MISAVDDILDTEDSFDHFCRLVTTSDRNETSFQIQLTQNRDKQIVKIREQLEKGPVEGSDSYLLYVAAEMVNNVIRLVHEKICHLGKEKTFEQLRRYYWFPNMRDKIEKFIRNCIKFIMYAAPVRATERTLYSIEKKPIPFDTLHLDHFGPLPSI